MSEFDQRDQYVAQQYNVVQQAESVTLEALHQLPPDIEGFIGREVELNTLDTLFQGVVAGRSEAVAAVYGMAGVGKSALALHAAHRVKARYPDAQLYANLRGTDGAPRDASEVLGSFLWALGVGERQIPDDLERRTALYRSLLSRRRALVVLDNVRDEHQIRPLLPGGSPCGVIITSRAPLTALESATTLRLQPLSDDEGVTLLRSVVGEERIRRELESAHMIARLCAGLPLAIRIIAGTLKRKPADLLNHLAQSLREERERLDHLNLGDLDIRASFNLSYSQLAVNDAHLFHLLGILVGTHFPSEVAAVLLEEPHQQAKQALERLVDLGLLEYVGTGRYQFHDLIRIFAKELAKSKETSDIQQGALNTVMSWYLYSAIVMSTRIDSERSRVEAETIAAQTNAPAEGFQRGLMVTAMMWLESERSNLQATDHCVSS